MLRSKIVGQTIQTNIFFRQIKYIFAANQNRHYMNKKETRGRKALPPDERKKTLKVGVKTKHYTKALKEVTQLIKQKYND